MPTPYFFVLSLLFVAFSAQAVRIRFAKNPKAVFNVEFAQTPFQLEQGLMFRKSLPKKSGMLFVFPESKIQYFWMKNTLIPLDMIFMDSNKKIVGILHYLKPKTLKLRSIYKPSKYVLEINAGEAKKFNLKKGEQAIWKDPSN